MVCIAIYIYIYIYLICRGDRGKFDSGGKTVFSHCNVLLPTNIRLVGNQIKIKFFV